MQWCSGHVTGLPHGTQAQIDTTAPSHDSHPNQLLNVARPTTGHVCDARDAIVGPSLMATHSIYPVYQ